jgi:ABC-type branched-subunit amino acid transport system substrate-binding protein/DNA-binding beta-propeller fold protein YncE/transcriptional regulator with XRE-family HTH domain
MARDSAKPLSAADLTTFGELLRTLRVEAGLTQEELAERAGLSLRGVGALEHGERSRPQGHTVRMLADALRLKDEARSQFLASARGLPGARALAGRGRPAASTARGLGQGMPGAGVARHGGARGAAIIALGAIVAATAIAILILKVGVGAAPTPHTVARYLPVEGGESQHKVPLSRPSGLLLGATGTIYVSDQACPVATLFCVGGAQDRVVEISRTGRTLRVWSGPGLLSGPEGLVFGRHGDLLVANAYGGHIVDLAAGGGVRGAWEMPRGVWAQFGPTHLALDRRGNVWATDTDGQQVVEFSARGALLRRWGVSGEAPGRLSYPSGIAVGIDGTIYVADTGNNRIERFTSDGTLVTWWGGAGSRPGRLRDPLDLAVDARGDVYVLDTGNDRIQEFSAGGSLLAHWGNTGVGAGQFERPEAMALDRQGMVYVADAGSDRIQEFSPAGRPIAQWGRPVRSIRLCASAPVSLDAGDSNGMFRGIRLATSQEVGQLASAGFNLLPPVLLDDASAPGYSFKRVQQNAEACLARSDVVAYIGPLNSDAARVSEPIMNRGGMVMISPANTAATLTDPKQRARFEPYTYDHRLPSVTYYRVVPPDPLQGPAAAAFMRRDLHVTRIFVVDDSSDYGATLASAMSAYARNVLGMKQVGSGHILAGDTAATVRSGARIAAEVRASNPAAIYCACTGQLALPFIRDLRTQGYAGTIVGADVLQGPLGESGRGTRGPAILATWPGPDAQHTSASFRRAYEALYHTPPGAYDASAYDAANIALQAVFRAARSGQLRGDLSSNRLALLGQVGRVRYVGATGAIAFDRNGDTTHPIVTIYRLHDGNWEYAATAPTLQTTKSSSRKLKNQ